MTHLKLLIPHSKGSYRTSARPDRGVHPEVPAVPEHLVPQHAAARRPGVWRPARHRPAVGPVRGGPVTTSDWLLTLLPL